MNWELQLTRPVRTHRSDLPEIIRTLGDAVDMIDEHLPETLRIRPVWQQVKDMLVTAAETRTAQDVETATALLERALQEEGWLHWIDAARGRRPSCAQQSVTFSSPDSHHRQP